jgi:hypothetical protein
MANWALVENNDIVELRDFLPNNWRNISNLKASEDDIEFLNSLNWYAVTKNYESYDANLYREVGYDYALNGNEVVETIKLVEKEVQSTPVYEPQVLDFETLKISFLYQLREERNIRLKDSDWTQLSDVQNSFDENTKNQWTLYRQNLRDLPQEYADNEIVNLFDVVWPNFDTLTIQE